MLQLTNHITIRRLKDYVVCPCFLFMQPSHICALKFLDEIKTFNSNLRYEASREYRALLILSQVGICPKLHTRIFTKSLFDT